MRHKRVWPVPIRVVKSSYCIYLNGSTTELTVSQCWGAFKKCQGSLNVVQKVLCDPQIILIYVLLYSICDSEHLWCQHSPSAVCHNFERLLQLQLGLSLGVFVTLMLAVFKIIQRTTKL
jgi:hypothetical protein